VSKVWDEVFARRRWGRWPTEDVIRLVAGFGTQRLDVLEVGTGGGAQLWYLEHEGHRSFGIDVSTVGIRQASERLREEAMPTRLVAADACLLPIAEASFDLVLDVETLAHVNEARVPLAWLEIARVLRPGGYFLSIAFTRSTYAALVGRPIGDHSVTDVHEGPIADVGQVAFVDEAILDSLAHRARLLRVECQIRSRTAGPNRLLIEELVYLARRPSSVEA
jgi:SAM-dependent methyltransferase